MITKRQLGYFFIALGVLVISGALGAHFLTGRIGNFGALQTIGVGVGVGILIMAIPLIRLGNRPA